MTDEERQVIRDLVTAWNNYLEVMHTADDIEEFKQLIKYSLEESL